MILVKKNSYVDLSKTSMKKDPLSLQNGGDNIESGNKVSGESSLITPQQLETSGSWYNHVYRLNQVIQNMTRRGLPIDKGALDSLGLTLDAEKSRLTLEIRKLLSEREEAKGKKFWQYDEEEDGYKGLPKILREECKARGVEVEEEVGAFRPITQEEIDKLVKEWEEKCARAESKGKKPPVLKLPKKVKTTTKKMILYPEPYCEEGYKYPCQAELYKSWFWDFAQEAGYEWKEKLDEEAQETGLSGKLVSYLVKKEEFNPGSSAQLKEYCLFMNYPIPVAMKKTNNGKEEKETTDDKALEDLLKITKDPMFRLIQDFREVSKLRSTYVEGWQPNGKDGRLHSTFTFTPATGQLSSRNPNVQNAPSHSGDFGNEFKKVVRAREGRVVCNFDYAGYHALMTGYFAGSRKFMRLSVMGAHDYLAAYMLRRQIERMKPTDLANDLWQETISHISDLDSWLDYDDATLRAKLKWIKKNHDHLRNKKAKPTVHGVNFGLGAKKMYEMNKDSFSSMKEAQEIKDLFFVLFPEIKLYQERIVAQAHKDKKLVTPYGFVRRFWEAQVWDPRSRTMKSGEDAEKAIAFLPACTAFSIKKEAMLRLEEIGANEKYCFFNEVHDSMNYEPRERDLDEALRVIYREMTRPVKRLTHPILAPDGLLCDVEISFGKSWKEQATVEITL